MSLDNLRRIADQASPEDHRRALNCFFKYQEITTAIAAKHGYGPTVGAAVFAALSPNNDYLGNLGDCARMLHAAQIGLDLNDFKVHTYGNNKVKAWSIIHGTSPLWAIVAKKTRSFYLNITDPLNPEPVTIDGHMLNCWRNEHAPLVGLKSGVRDYELVANGVRALAAEAKFVPNQMQGLLWLTYRRLHNIQRSSQGELWDPDMLAAQLGFFPAQA